MFARFMPREGKFFDLFNAHAEQIVAGGRELATLMSKIGDSVATADVHAQIIDGIETRADKITHETVALLHRTFITPLEKGDARKLERELKIQFDWRIADKNLAKEERNKPVDFKSNDISQLLQMETRAWKTESSATDAHHGHQSAPHHPKGGNSSDRGRSHSGQRSSFGGRSGSGAGGRSSGRRSR